MSLGLAELRSSFDWRRNIIYIGFIFVFLFFAVTQFDRGFLTWRNVENIINQTATITVMAVAMTFVIGAAQIDLSVGSVVGLASVTTAMAIAEFGVPVGIAAGLLTGALVGAVNGALVAYVAIPSFLVTLGMLGIAHGAAMWITDTAPQPILEEGSGLVAGVDFQLAFSPERVDPGRTDWTTRHPISSRPRTSARPGPGSTRGSIVRRISTRCARTPPARACCTSAPNSA